MSLSHDVQCGNRQVFIFRLFPLFYREPEDLMGLDWRHDHLDTMSTGPLYVVAKDRGLG
jgi:hypothetical protein